MLNIMPIGTCMSPATPMVAAATAAAMGVLTPMPCIPMAAGLVDLCRSACRDVRGHAGAEFGRDADV
ncbi:MAG: hypothetical protein ACRCU9_08815 [Iodobacter sp.]